MQSDKNKAVDLEKLREQIRNIDLKVKDRNYKRANLSDENINKYISGEITFAQLFGLSMEQVYSMAEIGYNLFEQAQYDKAMQIFKGLSALNPHDSYFFSMQAAILLRQDKKDEALKVLDKAVTLTPVDGNALVNRAELLLENGQLEQAMTDLEEVFKLDPDAKNSETHRAHRLAEATAKIIDDELARRKEQEQKK